MKKFAICDDDTEVTQGLKEKVMEIYGGEAQIAVFKRAEDLIQWLKEERGDVIAVFLDIELDNENGIDTAKKIEDFCAEIPIIFITGYIKYVQDIFRVRPVALLLKPVEEHRLRDALRRCEEVRDKEKKNIVTLHIKGVLHQLDSRDIVYVESDKRILYIYERNQVYKVYMKLDELEAMELPGFLRCHKSYMVNMNYIKYLSAEGIILKSGKKVPVSRSKYQESKEAFMKYFKL